ncbi:MAG: hypothetical protein ACRDSE_19545 [Pseudonocardiaceae bacterium]
MAAELVLSDDADAASPGVAAALAVLAGIAASDAACCAGLKKRPRGQDHVEAVKVLRTVDPHGAAMANDLRRLLASKDEAHYGIALVDRGKAQRLVGYAKRMTDLADQTLAL